MSMLNKLQLCAELGVSESTVRRLEQARLPYTPVGSRSHRYDLQECKSWLQQNEGALHQTSRSEPSISLSKAAKEYLDASGKMKLRVMPSEK